MNRPDVDATRVRETLGQLGDEAGPAPAFEQIAFEIQPSDAIAVRRRSRRLVTVGVGVGVAACIVLVAIFWAQGEPGTRVDTADPSEETVDDPGLATAEDQSSPEAVVAAYYEALSSGDLDVAFALLSPERREGVTEAEWSACVVDRIETDPPGSVYRYEHGSTSTEQGFTFADGGVVVEANGVVSADRFVRWAMTDIGGEWYAVAMVVDPDPDCLGSPFG